MGYSGVADTCVMEWPASVDNNGGGNPFMEVTQRIPPNDQKWGLVRFDVSSIPSSAIVKRATLELYLLGTRGGGNDKEVRVHKIKSAWLEGEGVGDPDGDPGAPGVDWLTRPSYGPATDAILVRSVSDTWYSFDVTSAARDWLEDETSNFGVVLKEGGLGGNGTKRFATSENATVSIRPRMTIAYIEY